MTAAEYQALADEAAQAAQLVRGTTEQVQLRGLTASTETFGLPACDTHLIAKLRKLDPALLATIRAAGKEER